MGQIDKIMGYWLAQGIAGKNLCGCRKVENGSLLAPVSPSAYNEHVKLIHRMWMMLDVKRFFVGIVFVLTVLPGLMADQTRYSFPQNIKMAFTDLSAADNKFKLTALIESLAGELKNIEIYFSSSADLKVLSNTSRLKNLKAGASRKVKILAVKTGLKPGEMGTWIKMGVRYQPDFAAIAAIVADAERFPDQNERQRLLDIVAKNKLKPERYHESLRYFLK